MPPHPKFRIMGDAALLVEVGDDISARTNDLVAALWRTLETQPVKGLREMIPGYRSLMIVYDPLHIGLPALQNKVLAIWEALDADRMPQPRALEVPVVYGGEYGPDLEWVAEFHGFDVDEVIRLHLDTVYRVYMLGFTPGYPYMGELPEQLATPRRGTPRTHIPKGSVAIAQRQTGIYPVVSPGGWHILGRTPISLFDPGAQPPALLKMGDRVTFKAITPEEYDQWQA